MATTPIPIRSVTKNITPNGTNLVLLDDGVAMGKASLTDTVTAVAGPLADTKIDALNLDTASQKAVEFFATAGQGTKADSALQPAAIGVTVQAHSDRVQSLADASDGATGQVVGRGADGSLLFQDAGSGDMRQNVFDPTGKAADAFDQDNMSDGTTNKNYTATEKTKLAGVEAGADVTDATNVAAAGAAMAANNFSDIADPAVALDNLSIDWSGGNAGNTETLSVPQVIRSVVMTADSLFNKTDTADFWPDLKALLETDNSYRDDLIAGSVLRFSNKRAWRWLSRASGYVTLPQFLHMEMANGAFIDATALSRSSAPNLLSYAGTFGQPTRPVDDDYMRGATKIAFGSGVVASRGWQKGDRLLIRATESLDDYVGAYSMFDNADPNTPALFSFWAASTAYTSGDGVIGPDGHSYRVTADHTSPAVFSTTNLALTGYTAVGEDVYVDGVQGDVIYLAGALVYDYPEETQPILCRYENQGEHTFTNFSFRGNESVGHDRGVWVTATAYKVGDGVVPPSGRPVICLQDHTSNVYATDLAAGRWVDQGSDRLLNIERSKRLLIEGGDVRQLSGRFLSTNAIADLVVRDHRGHAAGQRSVPGGYFSICGSTQRGLIENTTVFGGSQPYMLSTSAGFYGVTRGMIFRDCRSFGAFSAFSQHNMSDDTTYDNCQVQGGISATTAGTGFDIRTPSRLLNCAVNGLSKIDDGIAYSRAVLIRQGALGRVSGTDQGTEIINLKADTCLTGIQVEDTLTTAPLYYGTLTVKGGRLTDIGGVGSHKAFEATFTGLVSSSPPDLGSIYISDMEIRMNDTTTAIEIAGRWRVRMSNVSIRGTGTGRSLYMHGGGNGTAGAPQNVNVSGFEHGSSYNIPLLADGVLNLAIADDTVIGQTSGAIVPLTANTTLDARHFGQTFSNAGATAGITITLPGASPVYPKGFRFYIAELQTITLQATTSDVFILSGIGTSSANGTLVLAATRGVWAEVVAVSSTNWIVRGSPSGLSVT